MSFPILNNTDNSVNDPIIITGDLTESRLLGRKCTRCSYYTQQALNIPIQIFRAFKSTPSAFSAFLGSYRHISPPNNQHTIPPNININAQPQNLNHPENELTTRPDASSNTQPRELDLSRNNLTNPPDVSLYTQLRKLAISHNSLITPPDVSLNTQLKTLLLKYNQLTTPPDVSLNTQLQTLDIHNNELTTSPVVRHNPQLQMLDLNDNQLSDPPDVSLNPQLQTLYIRNNQLITSPVVSHNAQLQMLDLSGNQLTNPPNLSLNTRLGMLNLSCNQLDTTPVVSNNPELCILSLSNNQLNTTPDVRHNPELRILSLASNQLTDPPNVSQNPELLDLLLSENRLTIPPDVSLNTKLQNLSLSGNQLTISPNVSNNPLLNSLSLENNQLTSLDDSILSLSSNARVNVENNRFSLEYIADFQRRLEAHRAQHPGQGPLVTFSVAEPQHNVEEVISLSNQLSLWVNEIKEAFPGCQEINTEAMDQQLTSLLDPEAQSTLAAYLQRLRSIKDYTDGGEAKKNTIRRVEQMLTLACKNPIFKDNIMALINEGLETCGDRVLVIFNDIEIQWQFHSRELTDSEFKDLAIRERRYALVKAEAIKKWNAHGGDEVEIILAYQLGLKEALNLPFSTQNMLYRHLVTLTDQELETVKQKIQAMSDAELLQSSNFWIERMKQQKNDECKVIEAEHHILLEQAEKYFGIKTRYRQKYLHKHPGFKALLAEAKSAGCRDYTSVANFIGERLKAAIGKIHESKSTT